MKIGIHIDAAKDEKPTGIGLHVRNLVDLLSKIDQSNDYFLYYQCKLGQGTPYFNYWQHRSNLHLRPIRFPRYWQFEFPTLWWNWYFPLFLKHDEIDIFHGPNYFLPAQGRYRNIVTIHDLAFCHIKLYDDKFTSALQKWTRLSLERAHAIIAISEHTRRDLQLTFDVEPSRIRVIYNAGNIIPESRIQYSRIEDLKRRFKLPDKFILSVGTFAPRKNIPFLLRSFAKIKHEKKCPHSLVMVGKRERASEEIDKLIRELDITSSVIITQYVDDWEMPLLYKLADLFVLPTLYEGFTLVTLEAMAYGVPVIATDTSAISEGVEDAAWLVSVNKIDELARAMCTLLKDEKLRRNFVDKGKEQALKFSWERCAHETLALYQEVYNSSRKEKSNKVVTV